MILLRKRVFDELNRNPSFYGFSGKPVELRRSLQREQPTTLGIAESQLQLFQYTGGSD